MTLRAAPLLLALAALSACAAPYPGTDFPPIEAGAQRGVYQGGAGERPIASTVEATARGAELAFVTGILRDIQVRSFRENR